MNVMIQREIAEAKRRLEGIVESAMDAIITVDESQRIVLFNPAAEQMFGVSRHEALGQPIARFIPERYRAAHEEHIRRFRTTGATGRRMGALGAVNGLRADGREFPIEASISQTEVNGERLATVILRDITERRSNEEARLMLAREVDHRAKNALAVVQSLVSLTAAPTRDEFVAAVRGRVAALSRAHTLLAQNRWKGASLVQVLQDETSAYHKPEQITTRGPDVVLTPNAVQPIGLIFHELATNAVKYGAFSRAEGRVTVDWHVDPDNMLAVHWIERNGPPVIEPVTRGFGSTLISTMATRQLAGRIRTDWPADGIEVSLWIPESGFTTRGSTSDGDQADMAQHPPEAPGSHEGTVLLVEDEALVALELARALEDCGWEVVGPAATLREAFTLIERKRPLDAAVLDVNLNGEMVYPLADALEQQGVPFLFCSGYETVERVERYRYSPLVRKPTSFAMLMSELRRLLSTQGKVTPRPA